MKKLYDIVTNNINNKDQCNDVIEYDPKCDNTFSLSSGTKDPLPVVTVSLQGGKKNIAATIYGLTCLRIAELPTEQLKGHTLNLTSQRCVPTR